MVSGVSGTCGRSDSARSPDDAEVNFGLVCKGR